MTNTRVPGTSRLRRAAIALGALVVVTSVVLGVFMISDRVADEAIERVPLPRTTATPVATVVAGASPTATTPTAVEDIVVSPMPHPDRQGAASVVLADGRVLIVGGFPVRLFGQVFARPEPMESRAYRSAVIYDPATNEWTSTGVPPVARGFAAMVLPGDGRPLLWGGNGGGDGLSVQPSLLIERYDWLTRRWSPVRTPGPGTPISALLAVDGRAYALTVRGDLTSFDANNNTWDLVAESVTRGRGPVLAITLADGRALIFVERRSITAPPTPYSSNFVPSGDASQLEYVVVELESGQASELRSIQGPPFRPFVSPLPDGTVLVYGGFEDNPTAYEIALGGRILTPGDSPGLDVGIEPPVLATGGYRLDIDTGALSPLTGDVGTLDHGTDLADLDWLMPPIPVIAITEEGAERLRQALDGRVFPVVLPIDGSRVLVAGGSPPTPDVIDLVGSMLPDGTDLSSYNEGPTLEEIEAAIIDAGLAALELRRTVPNAVVVRVN
jgi:hypothetical protein